MSAPLTERSATELARAIREGEVTAREVVEAHLALVREVNPRINAVVADRSEAALAEADAADARVAAAGSGEELPPLLGVPCTIKESIMVEGMPNSSGVVAREAVLADRTAPAAQRLIDAGAIPIGLTNLSEMTLWIESENRVYGRTSNPYDARRSAGGSSGGEGASVGAGFAPFGLGSDIGGSIRTPAAFNGVFGHKPSAGLIPLTGMWPPATGESLRLLANGPLARRAEDLMPLLRILAGPDGEDDSARDYELGDPAEVSIEGLRVAVSEKAFIGPISREVRAARERAAAALADAGAVVEHVDLRVARRTVEPYLALLSDAGRATVRDTLLEAGVGPLGARGLVRRGGPHTVATRVFLAAERLTGRTPASRTRKMVERAAEQAHEIAEVVGDGVLLHPPAPGTAPRHGRTVGRLWWTQPATPFNLAGLPVTVAPLGLGSRGLPLAVQVVAGMGRDHLSVAVAQALERALGGWVPPPPPRR